MSWQFWKGSHGQFVCSYGFIWTHSCIFSQLAGQQGIQVPDGLTYVSETLSGMSGPPFPHVLSYPQGRWPRFSHQSTVFQEGDNERLRLRVLLLPCYIDQSESQGQPRFKGWKKGPRLFTSASNNLWSCLTYHKCQCTQSLINHFLVARVSTEFISIRKYPLCVHILLSIILYLLK